MAESVNVGGTRSLVQAIARQNHRLESEGHDPVRLVHLSIDLVFSGNKPGNYVEKDEPDPVTVYGKTMVASERIVLDHLPSVCLLRISLPMGVSFNGHAGAVDWIQSRFAANRPATLYYDEVRTPCYVQCYNQLFEFLLSKDLSGLFHAGGARALSLFEIAQVINRIGGYDPRWLKGCYRIEAGNVPPRAGNVSMDCEKLNRELAQSEDWPDELLPFATSWPANENQVPASRQWHFGGLQRVSANRTDSIRKVTSFLYQRQLEMARKPDSPA